MGISFCTKNHHVDDSASAKWLQCEHLSGHLEKDFALNRTITNKIPLNHPLQRVSTQLASTLVAPIQTLFEKFDDELFEKARQCKSNQEQETWLAGMRQMRVIQTRFTDEYLQALRQGMEAFYQTRGKHRFMATEEENAEEDGSLSLLDGEDLELTLAISDLKAKLEQGSFKELYPLEKRHAFMVGQEELTPDHCPLSPDAWLEALRKQVETMEISLEVRLLFLTRLGKLFRKEFDGWTHAINQLLIEAGILPDFKFDGIRKNPSATPPQATPSAAEEPHPPATGDSPFTGQHLPGQPTTGGNLQGMAGPAGLDTAAFGQTAVGHDMLAQPGMEQPGSGMPPAATPSGMPLTPASIPAGYDGPIPPVSAPTEPVPATPWWQPENHAIPPADPAGEHPWTPSQLYSPAPQQIQRESRLFHVVQDMLQQSRPQRFSPKIRGMSREQVPNRVDAQLSDVIGILTLLQNALQEENPESLTRPQNMAQVKQQIANQLLELETEEATPVMTELTEDIIDLVGLLFEYILEDEKIDAAVKAEIFKLELPMLKVALMNEDFFRRQDSPPRALLEALADLGRDWIDGGERERHVMPLVRKVVKRVLDEFDHNLDIFNELCEDIATARQKAEQKFERNKQRSADTFQGRERLFLARQKAAETVEQFTQGIELSPFLERFFTISWANYLALTLTRHGEDSNQWEEAWHLTETLAESVQVQPDDKKRASLKSQAEDLRQQVLQCLLQTGTFESDARKLVAELAYVQGWALAAVKPQPIPKKMQVVDEQIFDKAAAIQKKTESDRIAIDQPARDATTEEEKLLMEELQHLPFGTWLEYRLGDEGSTTTARLAWYSPNTKNCLLVNKSGQALMTRHILTLARDIIAKRCRILPQRKTSLIERGMKKIKQLLGNSPTAASPA